MPISHLPRSKIEDFYGNVQWKFDESIRKTLWEAKMHEKETYSLAYNFRLSIEETVCLWRKYSNTGSKNLVDMEIDEETEKNKNNNIDVWNYKN